MLQQMSIFISDAGEEMDINDLMQYGYLELRYIIDWARKVPGRLSTFFLQSLSSSSWWRFAALNESKNENGEPLWNIEYMLLNSTQYHG